VWSCYKTSRRTKKDSLRHFISFFQRKRQNEKEPPKTKAGPLDHSTKYINPGKTSKNGNKDEMKDSQLLHAKFDIPCRILEGARKKHKGKIYK